MGVRLTWLTTIKSLTIRAALSRSRKLEGTAEHLIDGSEKRICRLSFEGNILSFLYLKSNVGIRPSTSAHKYMQIC